MYTYVSMYVIVVAWVQVLCLIHSCAPNASLRVHMHIKQIMSAYITTVTFLFGELEVTKSSQECMIHMPFYLYES